MSTKEKHWQAVYQTKAPTDVSWYAEHLDDSLRLIRGVSGPDARVIDVGAGASTLVDDLMDAGYRNLTILDISSAALEIARQRLGERAASVRWIAGDVTAVVLDSGAYDLWHDRAVFHFLTEQRDRESYVAQVRKAVVPGGHVIVGTFSLQGPTRCSGLDVLRYDGVTLAEAFGEGFALVDSLEVSHTTPAAREQRFLYAVLRRGEE